MEINIIDWNFSTSKQCEECGNEPRDYWELATIIIPGTDIQEQICMICLGQLVTG